MHIFVHICDTFLAYTGILNAYACKLKQMMQYMCILYAHVLIMLCIVLHISIKICQFPQAAQDVPANSSNVLLKLSLVPLVPMVRLSA